MTPTLCTHRARIRRGSNHRSDVLHSSSRRRRRRRRRTTNFSK
jgi:hypothetical protein